jgi:hypothetical protein
MQSNILANAKDTDTGPRICAILLANDTVHFY